MAASSYQTYQNQSRGPYRPRRKRRVGRVIGVLFLVLLVALVGGWIYLDTSLQRVSALGDDANRPAAGKGTNWLLVGSDSREGLSAADRAKLATGDAEGRRTDTMMLLHIPSGSGPATLVSLPRDSFVPIPGNDRNKLNASYAFGGPKLLVQTVENVTGLRIDHYAEIGFGGFRDMVDAVGGVEMCPKEAINDPKAGLNLQPGCQKLNGAQALGYVRTRATPRADLDRVERQRELLSALMAKAGSAGTIFNPFRSIPLMASAPDALTVDDGDHLHNLALMGWAMSGDLVTTTVPIGSMGNQGPVGSVVNWDRAKASRLFEALANDQPVPTDLLTK
ncbi:LytTR family transcriptional regulator [Longimycelium tulufanense]|uniref:LytTR family transcriptional regulator n=1 Tax=Longimycelium tulufanense TaxID=907463 RepID=A0A8J3CD47_9PSEU|nr:LCP family protein [Longimycelium tulufanense]GGM50333.1 LytTR family transcriptional regulator [Longimycelium tulufanense]